MLKKVKILLEKTGEIGLNTRNRDQVLMAISYYGKLLKENSVKYIYIII